MTLVRRVLSIAILGGLVAAPADAGPLLFTFTGEISILQTLTQVETISNGQTTTVFTPSLQFNVPISGTMTFDSDVWSLVAPVSGSFPLRQFTVDDPAPGDVYGVSEFSAVTLGLGSGYAFPFVLQDLFPAGPPLAFTFVDPIPGPCSGFPCTDGLFSFGTFPCSHRSVCIRPTAPNSRQLL
jgi:hypothetical protein